MKKIIGLSIAAAVAATIACSGGGYGAPSGSIMQNTTLNLTKMETETPVGAKSGEACATGYLGIVSFGDAGIKAAAAKGGITKVYSIDYKNDNLLGSVVQSTCTIVHGD
ncbi:MAG: TRL-like family protein [Leptospiraceae bacterium]|nr:TRL-like family protein [Leptospiraceae bacterium]MCP5502225.1 TRL-like family protein [Leptospiraceae bacterium]